MLRTVWAKVEGRRRLYLIDERCDFVEPVKLYIDHLAAVEKSPHTLENYCRHLGRYFAFLRREAVDWRGVRPDDLVRFIQELRSEHANDKRLTQRSVNTIVTAVSSFYRYHAQRGSQLESPVFYEQISDRFSNFKRFLIHLSHGRTIKRTLKLTEPRQRIKTVADDDFARFFFLHSELTVQVHSVVDARGWSARRRSAWAVDTGCRVSSQWGLDPAPLRFSQSSAGEKSARGRRAFRRSVAV